MADPMLTPPVVTGTGGIKYNDFLSGAPEQFSNERRALLALMAERGSAGQAEYERNKQQAAAARQASIEAAAARGAAINAPAALQHELGQNYDKVLAGQLAMTDQGMLAHGREMDRIAAANASYMDQISGAVGLAQAMVNAQVAQQAAAQAKADAARRAASGGGGKKKGDGAAGSTAGLMPSAYEKAQAAAAAAAQPGSAADLENLYANALADGSLAGAMIGHPNVVVGTQSGTPYFETGAKIVGNKAASGAKALAGYITGLVPGAAATSRSPSRPSTTSKAKPAAAVKRPTKGS